MSVVVAYTMYSGAHFLVNNYQGTFPNLTMTLVDFKDYKYEKRLPNEREVEQYREAHKDDVTLLPLDFFVDKYKETEITAINPKFPLNFIERIIIEKKRNEIIFVEATDVELRKILLESSEIANDLITVHPDLNMLQEFIGRAFMKDGDKHKKWIYYNLNAIRNRWEAEELAVSDLYGHGRELIRLHSNEYMIHKIPVIEKFI